MSLCNMRKSGLMCSRPSVALLIETSNAYARGLIDGIVAYQREHEMWSIYVGEHVRGARPPAWLRTWKADGIIARIETEAIAAVVRRINVPAVDVSAARKTSDMPWVETDDRKLAQLAARHLIDRGFTSLAYCGEPHFNWSNWREQHFVRSAEQAQCKCYVFEGKSANDKGYSWARERRRLSSWLRQLPKPIGVMACYDFKGQQLLDVCRELDIAVPEQVAVIGVDNDARLCRLCTPPLSSVIPDSRGAGYKAAHILDRMMRGEEVGAEGVLISPLGIAERQSSEVTAIEDPDVAVALRYIREHACNGISVADVLKAVPLSRRMLERRFQKLVRRTPRAEIIRIRMERASRLLRETDWSLARIANHAGFADATNLSAVFKKQICISPREYRSEARGNINKLSSAQTQFIS